MPSIRISKELNNGTYSLTFVVRNHLPILKHYNCYNILQRSLNYHIQNKKVNIEGFVFMKDHIHLLATSRDMINFVRGFKRFTAKAIKRQLLQEDIRKLINKRGDFQLWNKVNWPVWIESEHFFQQKLNYIHENPVRAGYVGDKIDWTWSSANLNSKVLVDRGNW